jgi:FAD/FMN-containing dehydrogenase
MTFARRFAGCTCDGSLRRPRQEHSGRSPDLVDAYGLDSYTAAAGCRDRQESYLGLTRTSEEIAAMAALKRALDPGAILNAGVLL